MICLTQDELREVTQRVRPSAQLRVLRALGIAHRRRPDGSVFVLRESLRDVPAANTVQESEINWN